jgi:TolB-like protein/DNA-binding winged helix-turn-helix (wHTH) protein
MKSNIQIGFRLGDWRAYPLRNVLVGPRGEVHVEPKAMQVLERLADNAGEVVERDRLLEELWGGRAMSDEPLTRCIAHLRRVLDDSARDPRYIQTIPKRGYRIVCSVEPLEQATDEEEPPSSGRPTSRRAFHAAVIALALVATAYLGYSFLADEGAEPPKLTAEGPLPSQPPEHSIAVLPFANLSPDAENEYLSDGLAAELLNLLTRIPDLKVAARTSAFAFKGRDIDATEIARQLRVAYILSGSVRQSGDRLRISTQLIDARDGYHVWSDTWERQLTDIFEIQDEIAVAVADALRLNLLGDVPTTTRADPEAYALFLKSEQIANERREPAIGEEEPDRYNRAISLLTHALAIDADYAPAWGLLAEMQLSLADWAKTDRAEAYARTRASAERAFSLDPNETRALNVLGGIDDLWNWDSESAARWFKKSLQVNPRSPQVLNHIYLLFEKVGLEGHPFLRAAYELDPLHLQRSLNLALSYKTSGRDHEARQQLEMVRQTGPNAVRLRAFEALFAYLDGDFEAAERFADGVNPPIRACALHGLGRLEDARAVLEEIRSLNTPRAYDVATVYACWNDTDNAFAWLERANEEHDPFLRRLRHPLLKNLRDDPRWEGLARSVGVSDEDARKVRRILGDINLAEEAF